MSSLLRKLLEITRLQRLARSVCGQGNWKLVIFSLIFLLSLFVPQKAAASPQEFVKAVQEGNNLRSHSITKTF